MSKSNTKPKLEFDDLIIETTRRCNMHCAMCIRGNTEEKDMTMQTLRPILKHTTSINTIIFSGGEPSLNINIMKQVLNYVKQHDIPVYAFYIVTNAKEITPQFLYILDMWYIYCMCCGGDEDCSGIAISKDNFHEEIPAENEYALKAFKIYRPDKEVDFREYFLIPRGRAAQLKENNTNGYQFSDRTIRTELSIETIDNSEYHIYEECYISVNGDITADCNLSYEEIEKFAVGNTKDTSAFFDYIKEHAETY